MELSLNEVGLKLFKTYLPYLVIIGQAYYILQQSKDAKKLDEEKVEIFRQTLTYQKEVMSSLMKAQQSTNEILLKIVDKKIGDGTHRSETFGN